MRLTICGIKLSSNGLHVCVFAEPWGSPKSNQVGNGITLQRPSWKVIDEKKKKAKTWTPINYISITEERSCLKRIDGLREGNGKPLQYSCLENPMDGGAWWAAVHEVAESWAQLSNFTFAFPFHALEKEMATHSSVLAWRIPGTEEPSGLPSMGLHRVGHD